MYAIRKKKRGQIPKRTGARLSRLGEKNQPAKENETDKPLIATLGGEMSRDRSKTEPKGSEEIAPKE